MCARTSDFVTLVRLRKIRILEGAPIARRLAAKSDSGRARTCDLGLMSPPLYH